MFNFIAKTILTLTAIFLVILILLFSYNSLSKDKIQTAINICYDKNNQLLLANIQEMEKTKIDKEKACLFWKKSIEDMDSCIKSAYGPTYILMTSTDTTDSLYKNKEKQNGSCRDYPDTLVKKDKLVRLKLLGNNLIFNLTPLALSRGIP